MIGGDFELAPEFLQPTSSRNLELPLTGRTALYQILRHLLNDRPGVPIYLPAYLCQSLLSAARNTDADIRFFDVDAGLRIADAAQIEPGSIVVLIRYFGLVDLASEVTRLRSLVSDLLIVADEVHAPWSLGESTGANFAFTSWRKAYPVAGGAPIVPMLRWHALGASEAFLAFRFAAASIKFLVRRGEPIDEEVYLSLFRCAETMLDEPDFLSAGLKNLGSLSLPQEVIKVLDARRRRNYNYLRKVIARLGINSIFPLGLGRTPLFLPILLHRGIRDQIRRELADERIYCPVHWPRPPELPFNYPGAEKFYERELSLVIDYRYDRADMDRVGEALGRAIVRVCGTRGMI